MVDITSNPAALPQADPNAEAPTSSGSNVTGGVPGIAQPQAQTPQATNNAQAVDAVAKMPVSQATQHTGWFHSMLARMNQGDQTVLRDRAGNPVVDPQTGQVKTQPLTSKQMGRSILAGVLSAMAATESHQPYRNGNGIWENPSNEAVAAGDQAFQAGRPRNQIAQAQAQATSQRTQQYAVYDANMKMLAQTQQLYQLKGAQMKDAVDHYKDLSDQFQQGGIVNPETGESLYDPTYASMTPQEAEDHLKKGDITRDVMFPVSVEPIIGPDGQPTGQSQLRWAAIKGPSNIHVTQAMIDRYPELTGIQVGASMPTLQYLKLARTSADNSSLGSMIQNVADAQVAANMPGAKPVNFNWDQFKRDARLTPDQMHQMHGLAGMAPDEFMSKIRAMDSASGGGGRLAEALGKQGINIDDNAWKNKREEDKKAAGDIKPDDQPAAPGYYDNARSLALRNGLTPDQADLAMSELPKTGATQGQVKAVTENVRHQMDSNINAQKNKLDPSEIDVLSDQLVNDPYNLTTMKDIGGRGNQRAQILAEAATKAKAQGKPFDIGVTNQRVKFLGEYEDPKGRAYINRGALNNLLQHAVDLQDVSNENTRANVKFANTAVNKIKDQFGASTYTNYQTVSNVLKDELSLYFAGGYAPTTEQQDTWNKIQSDTATPNQTLAFTKEIARLAMRRADTFNEGFKTVMGYNDPNLITPAGKAAALRLDKTLAQMVSKYGSGGQIGGTASPQSQAAPAVHPQLSNIQVNAQGHQIGYDAASRVWRDVVTGQEVK